MTFKIGINGFGRIGRCVLRAGIDRDDIEFVGINDLTSAENLAYLLKYDSVHRQFPGEVKTDGDALVVNGKRIPISAERDPAALTWKDWGAQMVFECTGIFRDRPGCEKHISAGARYVMISAPAKGEVDYTVAYGVNHAGLDPEKHRIISNASCTTNCLAPMAKVLNDSFTIQSGLMTTIHSYTNNQTLLDRPSSDFRRGRAAAVSMIPTTTGAAKAVAKVLPELEGKLDGLAVRVPTPNVSLTDLTVQLGRDVTIDEVNGALEAAAAGPMKGVIEYCTDPIVSYDAAGNPHSCVFIPSETRVNGGNLVKVLAWYDNEWGFSNRMLDVVDHLIAKS